MFAETSINSDTNENLSENIDLMGGNAGNITVETENLRIRDGGQILASSIFSQGNAGNITVNASESIELSNELDRPFNGLGTLSVLGR